MFDYIFSYVRTNYYKKLLLSTKVFLGHIFLVLKNKKLF